METRIDKIMINKQSSLEIRQSEVETLPIVERILWDSLDTPTREAIIVKMRSWDWIVGGMLKYKNSEQPSAPVMCAEDLPESIKEQANDYSNKDEYHGCRQASYFGFLRGAMAMTQSQSKPERSSTEQGKSAEEILNDTQETTQYGRYTYETIIKAMKRYRNQPDSKKTVSDEMIEEIFPTDLKTIQERFGWTHKLSPLNSEILVDQAYYNKLRQEGAKAMRDGKIGLIKGK